MDLCECAEKRCSVRCYEDKKLPDEIVQSLIESAITSPSPSNSQPVRFFHLVSAHVRDNLSKDMEDGYEYLLKLAGSVDKPKKAKNLINYYWRFSKFMLDVNDLFLVGTVGESGFSKKLEKSGIDFNLTSTPEFDITTGISVMTFLLKAESLGLGTCVLTAPFLFINKWFSEQELYGMSPKCFITCGYPDEICEKRPRNSFKEIYRKL